MRYSYITYAATMSGEALAFAISPTMISILFIAAFAAVSELVLIPALEAVRMNTNGRHVRN